jgi:hypothetical protein
MKWLAAWVTFSCLVVPALAYACARLRAKRGRDYGTAELTEVRRQSRSEDGIASPPNAVVIK